MWDLTFDTFDWDAALQSIADKARGRELHKDIVEAMEKLKNRLGIMGHWWTTPELKQKFERLGIC